MAASLGIRGRAMVLAMMPVAIVGGLLLFQLITGKIDDLDQSLRTRAVAIARQLAPAAEYGVASGNIEGCRPCSKKRRSSPISAGWRYSPIAARGWLRSASGHGPILSRGGCRWIASARSNTRTGWCITRRSRVPRGGG